MLQVLLWLLLGLFKIQFSVYLFFFSRNSYTIFTCTFKRRVFFLIVIKSSNLLGLSAQVGPINYVKIISLVMLLFHELLSENSFPTFLLYWLMFSVQTFPCIPLTLSHFWALPVFPCYLRSQITLSGEQFTTLSSFSASSKPDSSKRSF